MSVAKLHILSLRKLSASSLAMFDTNLFTISNRDFIQINYLSTFDLSDRIEKTFSPLVFTSYHAVKATSALINQSTRKCSSYSCYAIEGKTTQLIKSLGFSLIASSAYSQQLVSHILQHNEKDVLHCTSEMRRDEIEIGLGHSNTSYIPLPVYTKELTPIKITQIVDGIICFSPSQMDSYLLKNKLNTTTPVFCIGHTTASHLRNLGHSTIIIAPETSEDSLVNTVVNYYQQNTQAYAN
jgi:uroporphyrinogen-III synthase